MALTARAQKLRNQMVTTPAICVERLRYMTESYQQTEGESNLMRRAKALAYILSHMTVRIDEGELFVGNFTSKIRGGAIAPELKGQWLLDELDTLSTRPFDRYQPLTDAEVETLRQYLPYWKGKSAFEYWQTMVPPAYQRLDHIMVATGGYAENGHHWAHTAADYEKLLKVGSLGIIAEAEERLSALDYTDPTAETRRQFYLAVQVVHQGLIAFAGRYAALAEQMAAEETAPARKAELEHIAATCRKVPAHPAERS